MNDGDSSSNESQSDYSVGEDVNSAAPDLKNLTLEEILALKDQVGLRTYKSAIGLQSDDQTKKRRKIFRRENKNRPREISSKIQPSSSNVKNIFKVKKKIRADPRFEAGFEEVEPRNRIKAEHKARQKVRDYAFIEDLRKQEKMNLEKRLAAGSLVGEERSKARQLIQKLDSREISKKQRSIQQDIDHKYTEFLRKAKESGEAVQYLKKKDRKKAELIARFNDLKKTGKLDKYLEKKRKKNAARDRKKMTS